MPKPKDKFAVEIDRNGYSIGPKLSDALLDSIVAMVTSRVPSEKNVKQKLPFINLVNASDFTSDNPLMKFAFSKDVLDPAIDYFGGRCSLDSIQILYSFAQEKDGKLKESQHWHIDYGDSRSFHSITYLNDVETDDGGPFVFVDKHDSKNVKKGAIIRRVSDKRFEEELGKGQIRKFFGKAGETVFVDPAACWHYGSRCLNPRVAIFVTFNSDLPYVAPSRLVRENRTKLMNVASELRPDIEIGILTRLFFGH
jgi:hypothetical protein